MHTTKTKNKIHYKGCPVCGASSAAIQINSRMFEVLDGSESDNSAFPSFSYYDGNQG